MACISSCHAHQCTTNAQLPARSARLTALCSTSLALVATLASLLISQAHSVTAPKQGPVNASVWDRNLVKAKTSYKDIVKEHALYNEATAVKAFPGNTLAYITPWNGKGYDVAKTFRSKFTHVSPVWYQLKRSSAVYLTGQHDVDHSWIGALRGSQEAESKGRVPMIVPRVIFELRPMDLIGAALDNPQETLSILVAEATEQKFDGWVLEVWSQWAGYGIHNDPRLQRKVYKFVRFISRGFRTAGLKLLLAVPPMVAAHPHAPFFSADDLAAVFHHVDGLSVMLYDHAKLQPGPNAPMPWVTENIDALLAAVDDIKDQPLQGGSRKELAPAKILLGLNLYGMDFTLSGDPAADPIVGHDALAKLKRYRPKLKWDEVSKEHSFAYITNGRPHRAFYPTLFSIYQRLKLAEQKEVGVSLWEIGQGLPFFYDLL